MNLHQELVALLPAAEERFLPDQCMSGYTTFRLGGLADCLYLPQSAEELMTVYRYCNKNNIPVTLLGKGSNVVISDVGIRGLTVLISDNISDICVQDETIIAQAGCSLAAVAAMAAKNSLSGLEFASGIPGTVGGGVMMNAGAYEGCLADTVLWTEFVDPEEGCGLLNAKEHNFGYRTSVFAGSSNIIMKTAFNLKKAKQSDIYEQMADLAARRRKSQPLDKPSAGSAFKRPLGNYAGKLISECNLRGYQIGGAAVSSKHAGFIVNMGQATAKEVFLLFCHVQQTVWKETGILLEPEVRFAGDWQNVSEELKYCKYI